MKTQQTLKPLRRWPLLAYGSLLLVALAARAAEPPAATPAKKLPPPATTSACNSFTIAPYVQNTSATGATVMWFTHRTSFSRSGSLFGRQNRKCSVGRLRQLGAKGRGAKMRFDSDYDWILYRLLLDIRKKKNRTAEAVTFIQERDKLYPRNSLPMRFLENHDEPRSLAQFGAAAIESYATLLFTLPGIPLIYAGQEIGETERPSLFEKTNLNWKDADSSLNSLYQSLIRLRKEYPCFTSDDFIQLPATNISGSVGAFLRYDAGSAAMVIANLKNSSARQILLHIPLEVKGEISKYQWEGYHTMTPRAGRITDAQEDGFVFGARLGERHVSPRKPIHGIVGVLQEVRRFLAGQSVGGHLGCGRQVGGLSVVGSI